MPKMDLFSHFLSKNVNNDVLCINGSKVTALNVFKTSMLHYPISVRFITACRLDSTSAEHDQSTMKHTNHIDNDKNALQSEVVFIMVAVSYM